MKIRQCNVSSSPSHSDVWSVRSKFPDRLDTITPQCSQLLSRHSTEHLEKQRSKPRHRSQLSKSVWVHPFLIANRSLCSWASGGRHSLAMSLFRELGAVLSEGSSRNLYKWSPGRHTALTRCRGMPRLRIVGQTASPLDASLAFFKKHLQLLIIQGKKVPSAWAT